MNCDVCYFLHSRVINFPSTMILIVCAIQLRDHAVKILHHSSCLVHKYLSEEDNLPVAFQTSLCVWPGAMPLAAWDGSCTHIAISGNSRSSQAPGHSRLQWAGTAIQTSATISPV